MGNSLGEFPGGEKNVKSVRWFGAELGVGDTFVNTLLFSVWFSKINLKSVLLQSMDERLLTCSDKNVVKGVFYADVDRNCFSFLLITYFSPFKKKKTAGVVKKTRKIL